MACRSARRRSEVRQMLALQTAALVPYREETLHPELKNAIARVWVQVAGAQRKAAAERQTLAVLIEALAPHKASLALVPQESVASTLARFGSSSLDPEAGVDAHAAPLLGGGRGADESLAETVAAAALAVNKARLVSARPLTHKHSACNLSDRQSRVEDSAADL